MFTEAKPIEADKAKANVMSQTAQPAAAVTRWRACQARATTEGRTSATASAATPTARNRKPAASVDPRDLENHPFIVMPTPASTSARRGGRAPINRDFSDFGAGHHGYSLE